MCHRGAEQSTHHPWRAGKALVKSALSRQRAGRAAHRHSTGCPEHAAGSGSAEGNGVKQEMKDGNAACHAQGNDTTTTAAWQQAARTQNPPIQVTAEGGRQGHCQAEAAATGCKHTHIPLTHSPTCVTNTPRLPSAPSEPAHSQEGALAHPASPTPGSASRFLSQISQTILSNSPPHFPPSRNHWAYLSQRQGTQIISEDSF